MSLTAFILVLSGAVCHALWNVLAKKAQGGFVFVWWVSSLGLLWCLPVALMEWLTKPFTWSGMAVILVSASAVVHVVYSLVLQRGYRLADFTVIYPTARGTGPLLAVLGAMLLWDEAPTYWGWIGIVAIVGGLFMISGVIENLGHYRLRTSSDSDRSIVAANDRSVVIRIGVKWGLLTGLCIAIYTVIDGYAIKILEMPPMLYYGLGLMARSLMMLPILSYREVLQTFRDQSRIILAISVLSPLSYGLILYALTLAPLSYVAPTREVSMLLALYFGGRWLKESMSKTRLLGTLMMVGGIALLLQTK
jgi:drug/metabolite transporter (DMT)-like permease